MEEPTILNVGEDKVTQNMHHATDVNENPMDATGNVSKIVSQTNTPKAARSVDNSPMGMNSVGSNDVAADKTLSDVNVPDIIERRRPNEVSIVRPVGSQAKTPVESGNSKLINSQGGRRLDKMISNTPISTKSAGTNSCLGV